MHMHRRISRDLDDLEPNQHRVIAPLNDNVRTARRSTPRLCRRVLVCSSRRECAVVAAARVQMWVALINASIYQPARPVIHKFGGVELAAAVRVPTQSD